MMWMTRTLYFWVVIGIILGVLLGVFTPDFAVQLKFLGDLFVSLIKMMIAPLIFCSVATGISAAGELKKLGRMGAKALIYFEIMSTCALALGLVVANTLKPGKNFHGDVQAIDPALVSEFVTQAHSTSVTGFITRLVPKSFFEPVFASGDILQVVLVAVLFGLALHGISRERQDQMNGLLNTLLKIFFKLIASLMFLAPIGAMGAMAFTIGKFGIQTLKPLAYLIFCFYLTCGFFVVGILGIVARLAGFNIFKFLRYTLNEILLVLGTSSSESALAPLMEKLERLGCSKSVVGLVVPTGYSFNLDGTNIYLTLACLFVAQAFGIELSLGQQLSILGLAMISSKGASGVTGSGFITLAATLAVVPEVPVAGLALILGVDRFMSEARAMTNMIGNGVATIVIAKWEGELDSAKLQAELGKKSLNNQ
jgi:aerobic C4-dicarboxylate transport protein